MSKRALVTVATLILMAVISAVAVFLAKGYTFDPKAGIVAGTGIIAVTSVPEGATVYLDDHLQTATNATINSLSPKSYKVRVVKDGFIPWEKQVDVKEGLVTDLKITLFPAIPTLYPMTFNGVVNPQLSPDGQKLAFAVPTATVTGTLKQKGGIWIWSMVSQPISFVRGGEPHQLVISNPNLDFTKATLRFSPDSKQLLATIQEGGREGEANTRNYLLNTDQTDQNPNDVTPTISAVLRQWDEDQKVNDAARIAAIKDLKIRNIASAAAVLKWSPDETKIMVGQATKPVANPKASPTVKTQEASATAVFDPAQPVKVYDLELGQEYTMPAAKTYQWLPDSRHIVLVQDNRLAVADYDGSNAAVVYAGTFDEKSVFPWPDYSRLIFVTSFPTPTASTPNLYGINLK